MRSIWALFLWCNLGTLFSDDTKAEEPKPERAEAQDRRDDPMNFSPRVFLIVLLDLSFRLLCFAWNERFLKMLNYRAIDSSRC